MRCPVCLVKTKQKVCYRCRKRTNLVVVKLEESQQVILFRQWGTDNIQRILREMVRRSVEEFHLRDSL